MKDKNIIKRQKREEKRKKSIRGNDLPKGFTAKQRKKGKFGLYMIIGMAVLAAGFGFYQISQSL